MDFETKKEIAMWLLDHPNRFGRADACIHAFEDDVLNSIGGYRPHGKEIVKFIIDLDYLLYRNATDGGRN